MTSRYEQTQREELKKRMVEIRSINHAMPMYWVKFYAGLIDAFHSMVPLEIEEGASRQVKIDEQWTYVRSFPYDWFYCEDEACWDLEQSFGEYNLIHIKDWPAPFEKGGTHWHPALNENGLPTKMEQNRQRRSVKLKTTQHPYPCCWSYEGNSHTPKCQREKDIHANT